jgi:UPF0042 nucleotide-binding protein
VKKEASPITVVVVTGLSGAGKSTALRVFEDLGFFCVDGLPAEMVPRLAKLFSGQGQGGYRGMAVGVDIRQREFFKQWRHAQAELQRQDMEPRIVFLEAGMEELLRRYAETRRPHPLESVDLNLENALEEEREILADIRRGADVVIDTSHFSIHDLRRVLQEKWSHLREQHKGLKVHVISFGFKYGPPQEADLLFDLRFLPNPYFDENLKHLTGRDPDVAAYALDNDAARDFLSRFIDFLLYLLPLYETEGRYRLTIAAGCTGGRHRSVAVAEHLHAELKKNGYNLTLEHRHMEQQ